MKIFIDLDDTLIQAIMLRGSLGKIRRRVEVGEGREREVFAVAVRPLAHRMLADCRRLVDTILLTTATLDYALTMNRVFKLGFAPDHILAREHLYADGTGDEQVPRERNICPDSILIDNLEADSSPSTTKRELLGLPATSARYIQIREFKGRDPDKFAEVEWPQLLKKIEYYAR